MIRNIPDLIKVLSTKIKVGVILEKDIFCPALFITVPIEPIQDFQFVTGTPDEELNFAVALSIVNAIRDFKEEQYLTRLVEMCNMPYSKYIKLFD